MNRIVQYIGLIGFCLYLPAASAQDIPITVRGTVTDAETGELIVGAALYVPDQDVGVTTNQYGYYSLTMRRDSVRMVVSHVAYSHQVLTYVAQEDFFLDISLIPLTLELEEVEVTAFPESALQITQMSGVSLPVQDVENLPTLLGESDVLRIVQLLPGVQSGVEGSTGLYVRGGGPDQNLYLLDGTQIYNPSHLFGFLGTFNSDAIKDVRILKGGFPARYGGRLSSVIDLTMKEGNMKRLAGTGSIGFLASRFTLEGPIWQDRASFLVSARRSYADLLIRPFVDREENDFGYYFSDINIKANVILTSKDRIYLSGYSGNDQMYARFSYDDTHGQEEWGRDGLGWSNLTATFRWNHIFGARLFSNVLVGFTDYALSATSQYRFLSEEETFALYKNSYESGIRDLHARIDMEWLPNSRHNLRFGVGGLQHYFLTGAHEEIFRLGDVISDSTGSGNRRSQGTDIQIYVEDDLRLSSQIRLNIGVHGSGFRTRGKTYTSVEPRLAALYRLNFQTSVKASVAYMQQYIHLLATTSGLSLPTDLWVPATARIRPQQSWQIAGGAVQSLFNGRFELSVEGYYKHMDHLIEYEDGADFFDATYGSWEDRVVTGHGVSYGGELFLQKKTGRTTGWIGYTLSWSYRKFSEINRGQWFPYRYDRRHDATLVISHKFSPRFDISATWVYGTGHAVTLPVGHILVDPPTRYAYPWGRMETYRLQQINSSRNGARVPSYHRLDVGLRIHRGSTRMRRTMSLGAYNAYNRRNAVAINASQDGDDLVFEKFSLLPIVPAISYQISF